MSAQNDTMMTSFASMDFECYQSILAAKIFNYFYFLKTRLSAQLCYIAIGDNNTYA